MGLVTPYNPLGISKNHMTHPGGWEKPEYSNVWFNEARHEYRLHGGPDLLTGGPVGGRIDGVTTALGSMKDVIGASLKATYDGNLIPNMSLERASTRGTVVHKAIEDRMNKFIQSGQVKWPDDGAQVARELEEKYGPQARNSFEQYLSFEKKVLKKGKNVKILGAEVQLYSKRYDFAGQMDLLFEIDGDIFVLDYKTGNVSEHVGQQLSAYGTVVEENLAHITQGRKVGRMVLDLSSTKNGKPRKSEWGIKEEYKLTKLAESTNEADKATFIEKLAKYRDLGRKNEVTREFAEDLLKQKIKNEIWMDGKPSMVWLPQESLTKVDNDLLSFYEDIYAELGYRMDFIKHSETKAGEVTHYGSSYKLTKSATTIPSHRNKQVPFGFPDSTLKTKAVNSTGRTAAGSGIPASSRPVNKIANQAALKADHPKIDMFLDVESSGLEVGMQVSSFDKSGFSRMGSLSSINARHAHNAITEYGHVTPSEHISAIIKDFHPMGTFNPMKVEKVIQGVDSTINGIKSVGSIVRVKNIYNDAEFESGLMATLNSFDERISPTQASALTQHFGPKAKTKVHTYKINPIHGPISEFSEKAAALPVAERAAAIERLGFTTSINTQAEFHGPGGVMEREWTKLGALKATPDNPFIVSGHGTTMDPELIRHYASKYNPAFSELLEHQFETGAIKVWDTAYGWHQFIFGLGKEDSKFGSRIRLPYTLQASKAVGGPHLTGKVAQTLEEYQASTKYNLQTISDMFGWWKPIKQLLGDQGLEYHHAAPDAKLAEHTHNVIGLIKEEAQRLAVEEHLEGGMQSINQYYAETHMTKIEEDKFFHRALENLMYGHDQSALKGKGRQQVRVATNAIKESIATSNEKSVKWAGSPLAKIKSKSGKFRGGPKMIDLPRGMSKIFKNGISARSAWGYGVLGGAAAFMVGSTYMSSRDETHTSILKTLGNTLGLRNVSRIASKYFNVGDPYGDKAPYTHSQMFTKVIPGVTMLAATAYLTGLRRARMEGSKLGVTEKTAENWTAVAKGAGKTMRLGIREIEENFPITRVFKAGAIWDYTAGTRNYGKIEGTESYKSMQFNLIEEGKATRWKTHASVESFIDASKKSSLEEAHKLNAFLNTDFRSSGHEKVAVRFTRGEHGETLVFGEVYNKEGSMVRVHESSHQVEANFLELHTGKTRTADALKYSKKEAMQNSLGLSHAQSEAYRLGNYTKIGYGEYLSKFEKPDFAKGVMSPFWEFQKFLNYHLELDAKGINESENKFYAVNEVQGILRQAVVPKKLLGNKFHWLDNLAVRLRFLKPILEEGIISGGNRFLETPFELIGADPRWLKNTGKKLRASNDFFARSSGKVLQFIERPHLGLNLSRMKYGAPQWLAEFGAKRILPGYLALEAVRALDHLMGKMTFSPTGAGPLASIVTKPYELARLAYAKMSDLTGLTRVNKKQEQFAPGSTGLGFFALPVSAVSLMVTAKSLYKHAPSDIRSVGDRAIMSLRSGRAMTNTGGRLGRMVAPIINNVAANPVLRGAMSRSAIKTPMQKMLSFMVKNPKLGLFAAAIVPLTPFIPGFLGSSKSYAELRDEFAGKRDVAIRRHRGWLLSSEPVAGSTVATYRKHFDALQKMDWENKVIWPSYGKRLAHNLTGGLYGRYMLEEYHQKDNPVYQSSPYGAGVPLLGPIIAGTIGHIIKPTRDYGYGHGVNPDQGSIDINPRDRALAMEMHRKAQSLTIRDPHGSHDISQYNVANEDSVSAQGFKLIKSTQEIAGFKGFVSEMTMQAITGKSRADQFTPYKQSAQGMYDPSQYMWQYEAGDVSFVGGEFLRRIFQSPYKRWEVNDLPNEFMGSKWIPQSMQTGTTFDKTSMGWLYATKRGWEQLFPEIAGQNPESYASNIKTEILKHMAPTSDQFAQEAQRTARMAATNQLTPQQEQRYYETMAQVATMRQKLYVHKEEFAKQVTTEKVSGNITSFDEQDLTFTVDSYGDREFRLAGISNEINDIRSRLIRQKEYSSPQDLDRDAQDIAYNMKAAIAKSLHAGAKVDMDIPGGGAFSGGEYTEAIIGGLNNQLIDMGAPLANTGNLSTYNMQQKRGVAGSDTLAAYWDAINMSHTFFAKKLVAQRDYMDNYLTNRVFNKDVKLWNHPVEHFIKPLISSIAHNVGINLVPSFTARRRATQQYWDVLKYIKYKNLEHEAVQSGNSEEAMGYNQMLKQTMIGINPMTSTDEELEMSLPGPERPYFKYFANEMDPRKRRKIAKFAPKAELRLLEAVWIRKRVESGARVDEETQKAYDILQQSKGYLLSDKEMDEYRFETGGNQSLDKYVRAKAVKEFLEDHKVPDQAWGGWDKNTNIENVEVHALQEMGEQVQDYGYFETQLRSAAYDRQAYISAHQLSSQILSRSSNIGTLLANAMSQDYDDDSFSMPTTSIMPSSMNNIATNAMDKSLMKSGSFMHLVDDAVLMGAKLFRMV